MSGGSYNYLCDALDLSDIENKQHDLLEMSNRLAGLGYAKDAAAETYRVLVELRQFEVRIGVHLERLRDVWKAVEWWDSCDWSEDQVRAALEKYRGVGDG